MVESWRCAVLVVALGVAGCGSATEASSSGSSTSAVALSDGKPAVDEDEAHDRAVDAVADQTFDDVGDTGSCTEDCGGHDAGFEWAKENDVTDSSECGGKSQSFIEGCEAYAQAVDDEAEKIEESGEDET
jgi:hypothetical protein